MTPRDLDEIIAAQEAGEDITPDEQQLADEYWDRLDDPGEG